MTITRALLLRPLLLAALASPAAPPAAAQEDAPQGGRSLHWPALEVEARLDADGRLHVRERHRMRFHGAWNGGERDFEVRMGQRLQLHAVSRVDPATGETRPVAEGELDRVDRYQRTGNRVRWRSRLPADPPFRQREIEYVLDYSLAPVLVPEGDGYRLDHDFAFPDRAGTIERYSLRLELDPAWAAPAGATPRYQAAGLPPGRGFVVSLPLRRAAPGRPAAVPHAPPAAVRAAALLLLVGGLGWIVGRFVRRERAAGRMDPLPVPGRMDEAWLREHVLRYPPEVVGAAWDRSTGSAEVAALLARLVQEQKLSSRVEPRKRGDPVLHLRRVAPLEAFSAAERPLVEALFFDGREETDTESVREHYKDRGFDPASKVRDALRTRVAALPGSGRAERSWGLPAALLAGALALLLVSALRGPADARLTAISSLLALAPALLLFGLAGVHAGQVRTSPGLAAAMLLPLLAIAGGAGSLAAGALEPGAGMGDGGPLLFQHPGTPLLMGLALLVLGIAALASEIARPSDSPERLALRRRMAAARRMLEAELAGPAPRLRDEWYPYLLAFGLGPHVDRWFRAHGARAGGFAAHATAGGASAAAPTAPPAWTGGGPSFGGGTGGGGGAGGGWGTAASSMAATVAVPSSSGGGGSSGGSSGGGGGGGW